MVVPVTYVGPWVVTVDAFPVDAMPADPVRVVAINGHRIDELRYHVRSPTRIALKQRLPVLEDVAPIALVVGHHAPVRIFDADLESVPRPARVAVSPAECEGEVLKAQADKVGISGLSCLGHQGLIIQGRGQRLEPIPIAAGAGVVAFLASVEKVVAEDSISIDRLS